jgi:catechol 2,3-dioxygenase-like lactoylglutathione lyase family enzyme
MTQIRTPLRQPESVPQSKLPAHIQPLARPQALGRAVELAFLMWEKRDLASTERFLQDFGLQTVSRTPEKLVARGYGSAPALYVANQGARNAFAGAAFIMSADTDLSNYKKQLGATDLSPADIPGGGRGVELLDPAGRRVWLIQDQTRVQSLPVREPVTAQTNGYQKAVRVNQPLRTPIEPAKVMRLGHFVLQTVDFAGLAQWYIRVLGLIPSDVQYLADGTPNLAFCRLDLGDTPADHHTVVFIGAIEEKYEHSAYEVIDVDAIGQGQQVLKAQGHKHMWGIGRHVLGSQVFDYWFDPDGFEMEHYADGDVFTADYETHYSPLTFGSIWAWGDDAPASMKPSKSPRNLWRVFKLITQGRIKPQRLKLIGDALDPPARPWL